MTASVVPAASVAAAHRENGKALGGMRKSGGGLRPFPAALLGLLASTALAILAYQLAWPTSLATLLGPAFAPPRASPPAAALVPVRSRSGHAFSHVPIDPAVLAQGRLRWGVIFDAGSTGSRVHIYRFRMDADAAAGGAAPQPVLEDEIFVEVKPGLSAYVPSGVGADAASRDVGAAKGALAATGATAAAESLRGLMDLCVEMIPSAAHPRTPISLRATAGLRLLGPDTSESILRSIRTLFAEYPFPFLPTDVDVMDGSDEGVFAWITVNYLAGHLRDYKHAAVPDSGDQAENSALTQAQPRTSAIMDLGGASTQLVFEPDLALLAARSAAPQPLHPQAQEALYRLRYGQNEYVLYETSYLGYGLMEARRRIQSALLEHPALGVHPLRTVTAEALAGAQAAEPGAAAVAGVELETIASDGTQILYHPCLSDAYEVRVAGGGTDGSAREVILRGHAQGHASCAALARTLFPKDTPCLTAPHCSFGGHFALPLATALHPQAHLYAFSYFYDRTLAVFDLPEEESSYAHASADGTVIALSRLRELADKICAFSMRRASSRSVADIEREKDAWLDTVLAERRDRGCRVVKIRKPDGTVRTVAVPPPAGAEAANGAAAATDHLPPVPADEGECMVEERPDLSEAGERAHAALGSPEVGMLAANPHLCLDLTYAHTLLHYGYDLPESTQLHVKKKIHSKEIGWCLGAILTQMAQRGW